MLRAKERAFAPLCNLTVEDLVPADHFYRHLEAELDLGFVRDLVRGADSDSPFATSLSAVCETDRLRHHPKPVGSRRGGRKSRADLRYSLDDSKEGD